MAQELLMPKLGLTMEEGTVEQWMKKVGDTVAVGDIVYSVATDKLTNDIESDKAGILLKIVVAEGETVPCKTIVAYVGEAGEVIADATAPVAETAAAPVAAATAEAGSVMVIGGGPGGYVAAIRAAQLGAKVTLIEGDAVGGTCLNRGCMPTKAILHSAEVLHEIKKADSIGIIANDIVVDWEKVQANRAQVVANLTGGVRGLIKANKIKLVTGNASFTGAKTVVVDGTEYSADKIIIASGSYPIMPGIPGLRETEACIDSTACLELDHIPESMLVIGGGVIGIELGSAYARFGTKVTVVEMLPKLLPLMDSELTGMVQKQLEGEGMEFMLSAKVTKIEKSAKGAMVFVETATGVQEIEAEKVLVCVGRGPNTAGLNLDKAGITVKDGFIQANAMLETNVAGVYAVGDCNGKLMLAHAAMMMGEAAAENAMGATSTFDATTSPSCAYIGPEFAGVGYTEEQLKAKGIAYKVGKFPTSANGKSMVMGHNDGMIKVIAGEQYGEILGVHILAPHATDMISEAALAIKLEATIEELVETVHCHPTVAEGLREAALAAEKRAVHIPNKK